MTAIGYTQAPTYQWWLYDNETTPELQWPQSIFVYDQMRKTDSQVGSILRAVTLLVLRTPWRIDPAGAKPEVARLVAEDFGLPIVGEPPKPETRSRERFSWKDHLSEALLMLPLGHSYFEQVYRVDDDGRYAHLRKLELRPAKTIERIDVATDGGLISIKQYWSPSGTPKPIPVNRLVAYIHAKEGGNWLGTSILRNCYKNWLLKDRLLRVWAQTIERNGMGIPLATAPEGVADLAPYLAMAKAWRAGEAAGTALAAGATLKLVGVEGTLPDSEPAVRYHDEAIAKTVLAHFLNLGTQTGSWALGSTFADFFTLGVQTVAQQIADVANQHVVEDLVDTNFGPTEPAPKLVFDEIGTRQVATAEALASLIDSGVIRPDEVLEQSSRQQYGLPPADPKTTRTPPTPGGGQPPIPTDGSPTPGDISPDAAPDPNGTDASAAVAAMQSVSAAAADDLDARIEAALARIAAKAAPEPEEDDETLPEDHDETTAALLDAIALHLADPIAAGYNPGEARIPGGEGGGRWTAGGGMVGKIAHALEEWGKGKGPDDPFHIDGKPIDREPLRRAAVARGITLKRGADRDDIVAALKDHVRGEVKVSREEKAALHSSSKFSITHNGKRIDVAVFRGPDSKGPSPSARVHLRETDDHGKPGRLVKSSPDLAALETWADANGHKPVADWARSEQARLGHTPAPAKAAKKAAPRSPKKAAVKPDSAVAKSDHARPLSGDELQAIAEIHGRAGHADGGWVRESDMSPGSARHLDGLVEQGWLQKHTAPDGNLYRVDPRPAGTHKDQADSTALVGDILPAPQTADSRLKLTKLNRGAIIEGHVGTDGAFSNEPTPGSRPVRVVVQRMEPLDQHGQPVKAPLLGGVGELGHFHMSGERPMARIIGHDVDTGRRIESDVVSTNSTWSWHMNPDTNTSADIEGEVVPTRQGLPAAAPAKAAKSAAKKAAPAKAAKKAAPKAGFSAEDVRTRLDGASTKAEGREILAGLTMTQLADVAKAHDLAPEGSTKAQRIDRLLVHTVGARTSSKVMQDAHAPHPDGLDSMEPTALGKYAREFDVSTSGKTDAEIKAALRAQGVGSPDVEAAKRAAEDAAHQAEVAKVIDSNLSIDGKRRILTNLGVPESSWPESLRRESAKAPLVPTEAERKAAAYGVPDGLGITEDHWAGMSYHERLQAIMAARTGEAPAAPKAPGPTLAQARLDNSILSAYQGWAIFGRPGQKNGGLPLEDLRKRFPNVPPAEFDAAIKRIEAHGAEVTGGVLHVRNQNTTHLPARDWPALSVSPAKRQAEITDRVEQTYQELADRPGGYAGLADIQDRVGPDVSKAELDRVLIEMSRRPDVKIVPESNQKMLSQRDRRAAAQIGNQDRHLISIQSPEAGGARPKGEGRAIRSSAADWESDDAEGSTEDVTAAAGHDITPGHDELHHYWLTEGLPKWAESPKPWTTLVALLTPHVGPEKAKVFASRWFIEHFGFAAGSDLNRVTHGHPPRGHRVGPG